ncbi:hypothetical protein KVR01_004251 [Diaporthe batatas]|uniref:uncharacterized protein n=1 Tax=Diaporthe batatas TaxID=748121 RepID=UPI001D0539C5|nr:uncharacterized protein KVR01_004251 [Diaporthe batatas]KAG8165699.1 hypothetical protein KVR01_004251 [Diaporthe batatas]
MEARNGELATAVKEVLQQGVGEVATYTHIECKIGGLERAVDGQQAETAAPKSASEPSMFSSERLPIINARVHGGDLRTDALMCHISFGDHRHSDFRYDAYIKDCFTNVYGLSIDEGLWLAKHGHAIRGGVDWPYVIGNIDKFVTIVDRVTTWTGAKNGGKRPPNLKTLLSTNFRPLCKHISAIIKKAGKNPDWDTWNVDPEDLQMLTQLQDHLEMQCKAWRPTGQTHPVWDLIGVEQGPGWAHAGYLRDAKTNPQRVVHKGGATMSLRPQARVKYTY